MEREDILTIIGGRVKEYHIVVKKISSMIINSGLPLHTLQLTAATLFTN